ncbi:MAG: hypothetical protein ACAI44_07820 [Candidatus Sericytochromatia bacterium]
MRKSLLFLALLFLPGCWAFMGLGIGVDEIASRPELRAQATAIDVGDFFARRMRNRPRKALVGNWMLLYEDQSDVYLGYPRFRGIFDDRREVEEVFRTPKAELESRFPGWRKIDGETIQQALRMALGRAPQQWEAKLEDTCIRVTGGMKAEPVNEDPKTQSFNLCFDKANLTLIEP